MAEPKPAIVGALGERLFRNLPGFEEPIQQLKDSSTTHNEAGEQQNTKPRLFTVSSTFQTHSERPIVYLSATIAETNRSILLALNRNRLVQMKLELLRKMVDSEGCVAVLDELIGHAAGVDVFLESCVASIPLSIHATESR